MVDCASGWHAGRETGREEFETNHDRRRTCAAARADKRVKRQKEIDRLRASIESLERAIGRLMVLQEKAPEEWTDDDYQMYRDASVTVAEC